MSEPKQKPLFSANGLTLDELIGLYGGDDDLVVTIERAETRTYELMRAYPEGVPSGVMFASTTEALKSVSQLLASMLVEMAARTRG